MACPGIASVACKLGMPGYNGLVQDDDSDNGVIISNFPGMRVRFWSS